jgi:hypothetical protein
VHHSSVRSATAGTAKTFLAFVATLSLLVSLLAVTAPVRATHSQPNVDHQPLPIDTASFATDEEACADVDVASGDVYMHWIANQQTSTQALTLTLTIEGQLEAMTLTSYKWNEPGGGEANITHHFEATVSGDVTITDLQLSSGIGNVRLSHVCRGDEDSGVVDINDVLLTSMCAETDGTNRFRVRNTGAVDIGAERLTYDVYGTSETGTLGALAAGDELFFSTTTTGSATVRLFLDGQLAETKASNTTPCEPPTIAPCPETLGSGILGEDDVIDSDVRSGGHYEFTDDGLVISTDSNTSNDKVALYFDASGISLAEVGAPSLDYVMTSGTVGPGFQLVVDSNGAADGGTIGILVGEPDFYGEDWWSNTDFGVGAGYGYASAGTLDEYLAANPDMTVLAFGFALGSGVQGSGTIRSITFACTVYTFTAGGEAGGETGQIAVFKTMCESIGEQDVCNGRDTSLDGWMVDFDIYAGDAPEGDPMDTVTVTLGLNANGEGNLGDGSQGRILSGDLEVGAYTVCEIPVAYDGDGNEVNLDAVPRPEAGNGGSTGGGQDQIAGTDCVVVEVTASGTAEVKFLDAVATGTITILKDAVPDNAQDFAFTTTGTGLDGFSLDDDADATLSNQETFTNLPAGDYSVTEASVAGWTLTSLSCSTGGAGDVATATADITLAMGDDVTCTFVNTQQSVQPTTGTITILKNALPDDAQDFAFTTTGTGLSAFSLDDDADATLSNQRTFSGLSAGSYTVTEASATGWALTSLTCSAGGTADPGTRTATITLAAGANVTCTFVNTRQGGGVLPGNPTPTPGGTTPQQGPGQSPREGTLGGTLPNTSMPDTTPASRAAGLLALLLVAGLIGVGRQGLAEYRRRR